MRSFHEGNPPFAQSDPVSLPQRNACGFADHLRSRMLCGAPPIDEADWWVFWGGLDRNPPYAANAAGAGSTRPSPGLPRTPR